MNRSSPGSARVDVLIVGAGPVGLTAALLCRRVGLSAQVVERRAVPVRAPAAHVVNARTFEIWRQAGLDLGPLLAAAKDPGDAGWVYWVRAFGGEVLGRLPFERQGDDLLAVTPTPLRNLSQHRLEPLLVRGLAEAGAPGPRWSTEWLSCRQDEGGVLSTLHDLASGTTDHLVSRWVIAADGAGSPLRRALGIPLEGPANLQGFLMVHARTNARRLVGEHRGILYWVCDPSAPGAFVVHDLDRELVYMHPIDLDRESLEDYPPDRAAELVRSALADPDALDFDIEHVSTWSMTAQVASAYRQDRVFLAGDAAHRFPPTGGLGLNTGVADVHNLVWRLAAVVQGWGSPALLDGYEEERRPVARHNAEVSLANATRLLEVPRALGFDGDVESSRALMTEVLSSEAGRAGVATAIAEQAEHFDLLGLQLGYVYGGGSSATRHYEPSTSVGARLPHGWVQRAGVRISTLDLVPPDRYTLFVGPECPAVDMDVPRPVGVVRFGRDIDDPDRWWTAVARLPGEAALLIRPDQHIERCWDRGGRAPPGAGPGRPE